MKTKVLFVTSHPIQYQVPVFRVLAVSPDIEFSVLFAMIPGAREQGSGFGVDFEWDIPLLEGYDYQVLENISKRPGVTHFTGCDTPGIFELIAELKPDTVIVNGWVIKTCLQALWACRRQGIPCLVRGEANNLRSRPAWKKLLQRLLVRQYAACLYIGEQNRAFYSAHGVVEERQFFSPYCVENERFENQAVQFVGSRDQLRAQWSIPKGATCYLFCAKFEIKKHPLELLEAFRRACVSGGDIFLLMVGDGELRESCQTFVVNNSLPVTFTGFLNQAEIVEAYLACDCLVLPSDAGETWGLVVNEAMACGVPAIVSDLVGCARDLVTDGKTGFTFPFGDWEGLAGIMCGLSTRQGELKEMGSSAREQVRKYSPEKAAQGILKAVHETISHHPRT